MEKRLLLAVVVVVLCGSGALALDPMGPPTAGLSDGQWGLGVDYMFSDMDLDPSEYEHSDDDDMQVHKVFGTLACGVMDNVEVFGRAGIGHAAGINVAVGDDLEWGSTEFIWGIGGKVTLHEADSCKWGALIQWSTFKSEEHEDRERLDFDELQLAAGPTYMLSESVSIYGGPFCHFVDGDARDTDDDDKQSLNTDSLGAYLGGQFKINEDASLTAEFQYTEDSVGFGAGVLWRI